MNLPLLSKLFVPGSRPELFAKALNSQADAVSFDLEDSVVEARKAEARMAVRDLLLSGAAAASGKTIIVRINPWGGAHAAADLRAIALPGLHLVNLPKPGSAAEVVAVANALVDAEAANGVALPIGLLLNIESPQALRLAHELAAAHPRVVGLQLGLGDLFEPLAILRRDAHAVAQAMFAPAHGRRRSPPPGSATRPLPTCRTQRASVPKRAWRADWALSARAVSTPARWPLPTRSSARPTTKSPVHKPPSPPPALPPAAASVPWSSTAR